jgi:UDPglucose--hexose-1-phosphate uridylyltransferase
VIIASERAKRPSDFAKEKRAKGTIGTCAFCPGNEKMTPPAISMYFEKEGNIEKRKDPAKGRLQGWITRCIPNLFPALKPEKSNLLPSKFNRMNAVGHHEIIIESPNHDEHPHVASIKQLELTIKMMIDRINELNKKRYVKYVSIFRNHGKEAGASLSHAHTQIIAVPIIPKAISEEYAALKEYNEKKKECLFCEILKNEKHGERLIYDDKNFIIFSPWASIYPFEFWIAPKRHTPTLTDMTDDEIVNFARVIKKSFVALAKLLDNPPYNFGLHISPSRKRNIFHWHLETYPLLSIHAGFEKSCEMFINTMPPELAAKSFREVF